MTSELTKSSRQTIEFFEDFIRREDVRKFVVDIRKVLQIPVEGLEYTKEDKEILSQPVRAFLFIPKRLAEKNAKTTGEILKVINIHAKVFLKRYKIESMFLRNMLKQYILFGKTIPQFFEGDFPANDFMELESLPFALSFYSEDDYNLLQIMHEHFTHISKKYPLALYINPHASKREIIDFININWHTIEGYRYVTASLFNPVRRKKNRERDDIIYANRDLPRKKIMKLLYEKYADPNIDYASIGKIISLEKKKRENK